MKMNKKKTYEYIMHAIKLKCGYDNYKSMKHILKCCYDNYKSMKPMHS